MSGINRFLSRRDKDRHSHGKHSKDDVNPRHFFPFNRVCFERMEYGEHSCCLAGASTRRQSSCSSVSSAFLSLSRKSTASLQSFNSTVECSSANKYDVLQPNHSIGPLNGLFVEENTKRKSQEKEKDEDNKVRCYHMEAQSNILIFYSD